MFQDSSEQTPEEREQVQESLDEFARHNSQQADLDRLAAGGADYGGREQLREFMRRCGRAR